jgi:tRNA-binding protein
MAVVNFPPKQIANFMSECLVLGAVDDDDVALLEVKDATNGKRVG